MKKFLLILLLLLFSHSSASVHNLRDILTLKEYATFYEVFEVDPATITIYYEEVDGKGDYVEGNILGYISNEYPSSSITIDKDDFPGGLKPGCLKNLALLECLAHEMIHIKQTMRGPNFKAKRKLWYETLPYERRPYEIEAKLGARMVVKYMTGK